MAVVMPIGPVCDEDDVLDTLQSLEHYAERGWRLYLVDDSRRDLGAKLAQLLPASVVPAAARGLRGSLYLNLSRAFREALHEPVDLVLRIDTDALVVGRGFERQALDVFARHPDVGCLGTHSHGTRRIRPLGWPERQLLRHLTTGWLRDPALSWALGRLLARALRRGYRLGESVLGGVCIYNPRALARLDRVGRLGDVRLARANLEEDHLFGLLLRSVGMRPEDFGSPADMLPIGAAWSTLPASPEDLVRGGKSLVHSVKAWHGLTQRDLRLEFARLRAGPPPAPSEPNAS